MQVGIEINGQFPWCGGSLISETEILTAAHCVQGRRPSSIKVIVGENDISDEEQMKLEVAEVLIHLQYPFLHVVIDEVGSCKGAHSLTVDPLTLPLPLPFL